MIVNLVYFSVFVPSIEVKGGFFGEEGYWIQAVLRCIIFVGAILFLILELYQIIVLREYYFKSFWNLIQWIGNLLSIFVVIEHGIGYFEISLDN